MATTYDFIAQNKRRTWLLVLLFPITFALLGYLFLLGYSYFEKEMSYPSDQQGYYEVDEDGYASELTLFERANAIAIVALPIMWCIAMLWMFISYYAGDKMLLSGAGAIPLSKSQQPEIYRLVENLCISVGLPLPRIYVIQDDSLNAFATGRDPEHASVALTTGIISRLERAELEGVIAHELSHIRNRDIRLMLIAVAGISFFTFLAELCFRAALRSGRSSRGKGNGRLLLFLLGIVFAIYGYLIAPLIRLAISRTREYQADATGALMTRNPEGLARALEKISADPRVEVLDSHASMAAMCIANPLSKMGLFAEIAGLFSTHPPTEKRIAKLRAMNRIN